ncbi:Alpha/Beta hydrolase protein [Dendryphion nanum]|uniref:Alpha/Beta hydrolase protein n=1 Tax=Dendryphion nanum TaxID=256645 RepID=A0A9P9ILH7_9PLEO|nr:Alpha/Beta hydrolase protein [Dendryphion nanum]
MPPSNPPTLFSHPTLGVKLAGAHNPATNTTEYRNLKYASIPGRWRDSTPLSTLTHLADKNGIYDASNFGPSCPHKRGAQAWDLSLVGNISLPLHPGQGPTESMSELDCLHITVTVPNQRSSTPLPVFLWIHGGGLSMGSNSWPQYALNGFTALSARVQKPVISVSVNYRTNIFGFLASKELGAKGNFGFKDQILAMRWVRDHIAGFGGDPGNVTAAGESAGGISLSTILCCKEAEREDVGALFDRVVVMSGETTLRKPRRPSWHEEMYREQLRFLGLQDVGINERVKRLREWDAEDLVQRLPLAQHFCAVIDGEWLERDVRLGELADGKSSMHKPAWCKEFVVGDTGHDGTVLKARILDSPTALETLHSLCAKYLTGSETKTLLSAYDIPLPHQAKDLQQPLHTLPLSSNPLLQLATDLRFHLPSLAVHWGWKSSLPLSPSMEKEKRTRKAHRYHFHIPNPFPGPFHSLSSHELDVAYLLQNFNPLFPDPWERQVAEAVAETFIRFVNGEGWGKGGEGDVVVFSRGDEGEVVRALGWDEYDGLFRRDRGRLLKGLGLERLWRIAEGWQGVRGDADEERQKAKL